MNIVRELGRGGFGIVHLVEDENGDQFARKTFSVNQPLSDSLKENVRSRFCREANVQEQFDHPNIMPITENKSNETPPHYVMPVAQATLFDDWQNKTMGNDCINAIMDILAGLEEMHKLGIYHRDLKPQNVLRLATTQGNERYAISDFGLITVDDTQLTNLTQPGMKMTSDHFTAPEICSDLRNATPASDIYSVGCILHLFVGTQNRIPCTPIDNESGVYADILELCTKRDPKRRFPSVAHLRDALLLINHTPPSDTAHEQLLNAFANETVTFHTDDWRNLVRLLSTDSLEKNEKDYIMYQLGMVRISELINMNEDYKYRMVALYTEWLKNASYLHSDCDGFSDRLKRLYALDDINCKIDILFALLNMGTSHNRWYVEWEFLRLASPEMKSDLARRFVMELKISQTNYSSMLQHLLTSIGVTSSRLHPLIKEFIPEPKGN